MKLKLRLGIALLLQVAFQTWSCDVDNPPRLFARAPRISPGSSVKLWIQNGYLPQVPVLVRVELRNQSGERDWTVWDIDALLSVDRPGITLSTDRITLHNGLGSALVTC